MSVGIARILAIFCLPKVQKSPKYSSCKYDDILAFLGMRNNRKTIKKLKNKI